MQITRHTAAAEVAVVDVKKGNSERVERRVGKRKRTSRRDIIMTRTNESGFVSFN